MNQRNTQNRNTQSRDGRRGGQQNNRPRGPHPLQRELSGAMRVLRSNRGRQAITREEQETVAYNLNHINQYGFEFFPQVYIRDAVMSIKSISDGVEARINTVSQ